LEVKMYLTLNPKVKYHLDPSGKWVILVMLVIGNVLFRLIVNTLTVYFLWGWFVEANFGMQAISFFQAGLLVIGAALIIDFPIILHNEALSIERGEIKTTKDLLWLSKLLLKEFIYKRTTVLFFGWILSLII
jgi:hypothetical protein